MIFQSLDRKKSELFQRKHIQTEECRDVVSRHLKAIYETVREVLLLARRELHFPIGEKEYREIMTQQIDAMEKNLKDFYILIRTHVTKKMQ